MDIQIANIGDQPLEVKGITGSENFALVNSKMVAVGSEEIIQFQFTPKNAGTREETVFCRPLPENRNEPVRYDLSSDSL